MNSPGAAAGRWKGVVGTDETTALLDRTDTPGRGVLILAHSSGGHLDFRTTVSLAREYQARGVDVVRFNFLYRELGKGPPDRMPRLVECFEAVVRSVRERLQPPRLFIGGHSMGGRTASMMAADGFPSDGLILLGYPLHPAGQPDKLRDAHLPRISQRTLCLNGTRDDLCRRDLMEEVLPNLPPTFTMHWLEGADHSFHVQKRSGRTDADVLEEIGRVSGEWLRYA
jgi:uncharacterized protein